MTILGVFELFQGLSKIKFYKSTLQLALGGYSPAFWHLDALVNSTIFAQSAY